MYFSHPTPIAITCRLIGIDRRLLAEIASIYDSIWVDQHRVDIYKVAYLVEWLRLYQERDESVSRALARLLGSMPEKQPDCADCGRYAAGIHETALKELGIESISSDIL